MRDLITKVYLIIYAVYGLPTDTAATAIPSLDSAIKGTIFANLIRRLHFN